jgi:hypothetical protein
LGKKGTIKLKKSKEKEKEINKEKEKEKEKESELEESEYGESKGAQKILKQMEEWTGKTVVGIEEWNSRHFLEYIKVKFQDAYGVDSAEWNVSGMGKSSARGIMFSYIKKNLIHSFIAFGYGNEQLKEYINWCYDVKAPEINFPITLKFLGNRTMITEWIVKNYGSKKRKTRGR